MTFIDRQADLDDLISSCRSENAKVAFAEAVACFRAGAYRACIVSTWTAVVFDYVGKLRELELDGNGTAKSKLASFENARAQNDIALSLSLERELLDDAHKHFELVNPIEIQDLKRLQDDRNRCAHPSLLTLDLPYSPTAELARCHLRNAVMHLLSQPPVQGKEALGRIRADIASEYFPESVVDAEKRLSQRLKRARPSLVATLVVEITKNLLSFDTEDAHPRYRAALGAITRLHHAEVLKTLSAKLPTLADQVQDGRLRLLLAYCSSYELAWSALGMEAQGRLELYVRENR